MVKNCPRCKRKLEIENFHRRANRENEYQSYCKECIKNYKIYKYKYKKCSACKQLLKIENFYKCSSSKTGYQYYCIECAKSHRNSRNPNYKQCSKCKKFKSRATSFYESRITEDKLFDMCKDCCVTHKSNNNGTRHYEKYFSSSLLYVRHDLF